jgi:hypothetical protein
VAVLSGGHAGIQAELGVLSTIAVIFL